MKGKKVPTARGRRVWRSNPRGVAGSGVGMKVVEMWYGGFPRGSHKVDLFQKKKKKMEFSGCGAEALRVGVRVRSCAVEERGFRGRKEGGSINVQRRRFSVGNVGGI